MDEKERNKELIEKYPFLFPIRDYYPDVPENISDFDYSETLLDYMPVRWKERFGETICMEIKEALIKHDYLDNYEVYQIKEKFGELCWYDNADGIEEITNIIEKYELVSRHTCVGCGSFSAHILPLGWVRPLCRDCFGKIEPTQSYDRFVAAGLHLSIYNNDVITEKEKYEIFRQYELLSDLSYEDGIPDNIRQKMRDIVDVLQGIIKYHIG